jgi:hypothetical protein
MPTQPATCVENETFSGLQSCLVRLEDEIGTDMTCTEARYVSDALQNAHLVVNSRLPPFQGLGLLDAHRGSVSARYHVLLDVSREAIH